MQGDFNRDLVKQGVSHDTDRFDNGLQSLEYKRESIQRDQRAARVLAHIVAPILVFGAPPIFVFLALVIVFQLDPSSVYSFSLTTTTVSFIFSGLSILITFLLAREMTKTALFTFVRVRSIDNTNNYGELKTGPTVLRRPKKVIDSISEGLKEHYDNYAKKEIQSERVKEAIKYIYRNILEKALRHAYDLSHKFSFFAGYLFLTILIIVWCFGVFVTQKSHLWTNSLWNIITVIGVLLFSVSFLYFVKIWQESLIFLQDPQIIDLTAPISHIDQIYGKFPKRVRAGDSRLVELTLVRDRPECYGAGLNTSRQKSTLPVSNSDGKRPPRPDCFGTSLCRFRSRFRRSEYLEAEINVAGVDVIGEKKLSVPYCFYNHPITWGCFFKNAGEHTAILRLYKVDLKKGTKSTVYQTDFNTEVIRPFSASLGPVVIITIPALSAIAAILTALHFYL